MKKYNKYLDLYKGIYLTKKQVVLSYITGIIFALIFTLPLLLLLINLSIFTYQMKYTIIYSEIISLLFIYIMLYFKDKAIIEYNNDAKNINLSYIRLVDFTIIAIGLTIILFIISIIFRWW